MPDRDFQILFFRKLLKMLQLHLNCVAIRSSQQKFLGKFVIFIIFRRKNLVLYALHFQNQFYAKHHVSSTIRGSCGSRNSILLETLRIWAVIDLSIITNSSTLSKFDLKDLPIHAEFRQTRKFFLRFQCNY